MVTDNRPRYVKTFYISLLIIIIVFVMIMAKQLLVPLLMSGYIAMLLTNLCERLEVKKIPRSLAAFFALSLFLIAISAVVFLIVWQVSTLITDLKGDLPKLNNAAISLNQAVDGYFGLDMGMGYGFDFERVIKMLNNGEDGTSEFLTLTIGTISNILLMPVLIFFWLIYRDHLAVFITKVFEKEKNRILMEHIVSIRKIVHAYVTGAGKVMIILGIVNSAVLFALGIEHALFFGFTAGMLNIVPYLGPMVGAMLPIVFSLLTKDGYFYPVAVAVSFTFIQFLEGTFLTPKITGSNVNLNAFITVIGLLIGGTIWGIAGMILIIPTIAILKRLFELNPATEPYAYLFGEEDTRWFRRIKRQI